MKQTISGIYIASKVEVLWNWIKSIFNTDLDKKMEKSTMDAHKATDKYEAANNQSYKVEPKEVKPSEDINNFEEIETPLNTGKFSKDEVSEILNVTKDQDFKKVEWDLLSKGLNRSVKSLKAKARKLNK